MRMLISWTDNCSWNARNRRWSAAALFKHMCRLSPIPCDNQHHFVYIRRVILLIWNLKTNLSFSKLSAEFKTLSFLDSYKKNILFRSKLERIACKNMYTCIHLIRNRSVSDVTMYYLACTLLAKYFIILLYTVFGLFFCHYFSGCAFEDCMNK
jgi:hypothetical protein